METTPLKTKKFAIPSLFLVAMIWGGGFVAGKMALEGFSPFLILMWRFLISALLCGILFFRKIRTAPRRTILSGCLIGCVQLLALSLQLIGLEYTTPAKQSFLCTAYVAMVPFISWIILRKKPHLRAVLAGFLALCGIGLICLNGKFSVSIGDILSLGFSVVFGIQIVLIGKFVRADTDALQMSFFQFLTAGLLALIICLFRGESFFSQNPEALAGMAYLAILNTMLAFLLQNAAQKYVSGPLTALILSLESVFGFLFSLLYYREPLTGQLIIGSILCFAAILINSLRKKNTTIIRPARESDLDAVNNSYTELLLHEQRTGISNTNWVLGVYPCRATAERAFAAKTLYVLEKDGTLCASMILNQNQAEVYSELDWAYPAKPEHVLVLHTLCIPPSHASKGYGTGMIKYAETLAGEMNCSALRLDTFAGNKPAAALYRKLGFRYVGIRPTLHEGVIPEELIFFEKQI